MLLKIEQEHPHVIALVRARISQNISNLDVPYVDFGAEMYVQGYIGALVEVELISPGTFTQLRQEIDEAVEKFKLERWDILFRANKSN